MDYNNHTSYCTIQPALFFLPSWFHVRSHSGCMLHAWGISSHEICSYLWYLMVLSALDIKAWLVYQTGVTRDRVWVSQLLICTHCTHWACHPTMFRTDVLVWYHFIQYDNSKMAVNWKKWITLNWLKLWYCCKSFHLAIRTIYMNLMTTIKMVITKCLLRQSNH